MNINRMVRDSAERQAAIDSQALPKAATKRIKSNGEAMAEYHEVGYGLHFCLHDRTYYEICNACKRTRRDAQRNLNSL